MISAIYMFKWQNSSICFPHWHIRKKLRLGIYQYIPIKTAKISTTDNSECWQYHGVPTLWKSLRKNGWCLLKLNKVIHSFAEYLTESHIYEHKKAHTRNYIALLMLTPNWKQSKYSRAAHKPNLACQWFSKLLEHSHTYSFTLVHGCFYDKMLQQKLYGPQSLEYLLVSHLHIKV